MTKRTYLYSPWRLDYILGEKPEDCVMCRAKDCDDDLANLILYRGKDNYIMLNRYPYNNGHIMIVPYQHIAKISELEPESWQEAGELIKICEQALYKAYGCDGINIGMNLGTAAGAGISEHLHIHILPRFLGDSNFMSVVAGERVVPEAFEITYKRLKTAILETLKQ